MIGAPGRAARAPSALGATVLAALALAALAVPVGTAAADGARAQAVGRGCQRIAGMLALRTASGHRTAPFLPGANLASTPVCHDLTGDGRLDVAFGILGGGSGGAFEWAVFRRTARGSGSLALRFRKVAERRSGGHTGLGRRGRLLVVRNPVYRRGDPNCCPTGGEVRRFYRVGARNVRLVARRRISG